MRYHYHEFYKKGRNYSPQDFQHTCELMAGGSLEQFFARYVRGREELDYDAALTAAGLHLDLTGAPVPKFKVQDYLGATMVQEGDRLLVRSVIAGSAAYQQGLNAGDQIVPLMGGPARLLARLRKETGDLVRLTIFRFDELRVIELKLGERKTRDYKIFPVANPTEQQKKFYQDWLKAPLLK